MIFDNTALHIACKNGFADIVKLLLDYNGINVNVKDLEIEAIIL